MDKGFSPPLRTGIHMIVEEGRFKVAVSVENPNENPVNLTTMTSNLFTPRLEKKDSTVLWQNTSVSMQAVTNWELAANSRITSHFVIPNEELAERRAQKRKENHIETMEDFDREISEDDFEFDISPLNYHPDRLNDEPREDEENVDDQNIVIRQTAVEPEDVGIVYVKFGVPCDYSYSLTASRMFDLRSRMGRELDESLPSETLEAIERV